ncbi:hypothetical protein M6B38_389015 [Iris pallida]|uniref:Uncharacterized protein n=1 Tax=Iris pallida TaxID=29817 RepID=A0AAX6G0Z0_IRIPA|nr:hypothetical protein M6B38_389015 [Iris pallida]
MATAMMAMARVRSSPTVGNISSSTPRSISTIDERRRQDRDRLIYSDNRHGDGDGVALLHDHQVGLLSTTSSSSFRTKTTTMTKAAVRVLAEDDGVKAALFL